MLRQYFLSVMALILAVMVPASGALAQKFPSSPITIVIGTSPGGVLDAAARAYAEAVSRSVGQPVIIETKPAGAGVVAAVAVQNAKPDGHTLLMFPGSQMATLPAMQSVPYDPLVAFVPITFMFDNAALLTVPYDGPAKSVAEFLAYGKKKEGGLLFGSQGIGVQPHLLAARISSSTRTPMVFVQYRGASMMMSDLLAGRVDAAFPGYTATAGHFAENKLRALAVDADRRLPQLPDVPTLKESGINEQVARWFGIAAPAGTPADVVERLNFEFVKASKDPDVIRRLEQNGVIVNTGTPQKMANSMRDEAVAMKQLVTELGLKQQ